MAQSRAQRGTHLEEAQAPRQAAVQAIARERVLRQVLEEFDPQPSDADLDYLDLLIRVRAVVETAMSDGSGRYGH